MRINQLFSEPNYHAIKGFPENLVAIKMRKTEVKMNKPVYLDLSILEISKTLMYQFWYDYILNQSIKIMQNYAIWIQIVLLLILKQKIFMKILKMMLKKDLTHQIVSAAPLNPIDHHLQEKIKKMIGLMKDELGGKIITKFEAYRPKTYLYLMVDDREAKKAKETKKSVIKKILKFNDYKDCLLNSEIILKSQQIFKSERQTLYTEEINKILLSSNDDKRLQTNDRITSYPYGTSDGKECKTEILSKVNIK